MNNLTAIANLRDAILRIDSPSRFDDLALEVFRHQYLHNGLYRRYCSLLGKDSENISSVEDIPFLPIQFFKNYRVKTGVWRSEGVFSSSGTTGSVTSRHWVRNVDFYRRVARQGFEGFYGAIENYCVLGLLPSYLERSGSSLIDMVADFISLSKHGQSGFFLRDTDELVGILKDLEAKGERYLLIGVSFALLDFAERHSLELKQGIIMETGGMKGRRRELTREELHECFNASFHSEQIHSEYGMTELFSQAYAKARGIFHPSPTLRAYSREVTNPLEVMRAEGKTGVLNFIDLGNLDTCSFIATDDLGRIHPNGAFEVLGRLDNSDIRGCNLLIID